MVVKVGGNVGKSDYQGSENTGKNQGETLPRVKQVAVMLGESEDVIRNWVKELREYIPVTKAANNYQLFTEEAIGVLKLIQRMNRSQGYTIKQIEAHLSSGLEFRPTSQKADADPVPDVYAELAEMKELMKQQGETLRRQVEFNQELLSRLDKQQQYIERAITERHDQVNAALQEFREVRLLQAAATKERGFLSKLFGKG